MQLSYPITEYRKCVEMAFCELLLKIEYASQLPDTERFTKFLTRVKEGDPNLQLPDFCGTGLPDNWCYAQYNRGPLQIVDDDEFRYDKVRVINTAAAEFQEDRWGFGIVELNWWLVGNNGTSTEACEALYYMRLYKLKSLDYQYQNINWHSRIIHDSLNSFETVDLDSLGTAFAVQWTMQLYVPVLKDDIEGRLVIETCADLYAASIECDLPIEGYRNDSVNTENSEFFGTVSSKGDGSIEEKNF